MNPEVDRWFADGAFAREPEMRRIREIILASDPRVSEYVKYRTLTFAFEGDLAAFVGQKKGDVALMFNRGARIPGTFPHLEGTGPTARFMRFANLGEVEARAEELGDVVVAWCKRQSPRP